MNIHWKVFAAPLLCLSLGGVSVAWAGDATATTASNPVVATVNGKAFHQSDIDEYVQEHHLSPAQAKQRLAILDDMVARELVYQDAVAKKLDERPDVVADIAKQRVNVLINAAVRNAIESKPITQDELQAEYKKQLPSMEQPEYKARHILVKTEKEANEIIAKLKKGASFAKLAKEKSIDPGSAKKGGELGWFSARQMVAPFSDAVAQLKKGSYTKTPVQTQFGWHVIQLEDTRVAKAPSFDDVKQQLRAFLQRRHIQDYIKQLQDAAKVDIKIK